MLIERCGYRDDEYVTVAEIGEIVSETQVGDVAQFFIADFERCVVASLQRRDSRRADVETDDRETFPEFHRQWQADNESPVGRYGEPEDVANLVCFLASPPIFSSRPTVAAFE